MGEVKHSMVEVGGVRHHVAEVGSGTPLVLLHGWPEFWATWEPMFDRLGDRYRLIAPDFRGFGESDNPHPEPTDAVNADSLAVDVIGLFDALGLERAGVVGHDVGAAVMHSFAARAPQRAIGLFFFNCATHGVGTRWNAPSHINEIWYQTLHQMPFAAELIGASRASCHAYISYQIRHWTHKKDAFDAVMERWIDNFMRPGNLQGGFNYYIGQNAGRLAVMSGTATKPAKIDLPTRVLWGRHDPVLKADWADVLDEYFSDLELSIAEDAGHFVHYEAPDLAAAEIDRFFSRLRG